MRTAVCDGIGTPAGPADAVRTKAVNVAAMTVATPKAIVT
jgi:hypothetical protein